MYAYFHNCSTCIQWEEVLEFKQQTIVNKRNNGQVKMIPLHGINTSCLNSYIRLPLRCVYHCIQPKDL